MSAPLIIMRILKIIFIISALFILSGYFTHSAAQSRISYTPELTAASIGDTIEISLSIESGVVDLFAYTTHVKYDTLMLQLIDAYPSSEWLALSGTSQFFIAADSLETDPETNEENWYLHVFDVLFTNPKKTIDGYAELSTLKFEVIGSGISQIYYEYYKGSDTLLNSIIDQSGVGTIYVCPLPMIVGDLNESGFIDIADLVYFVDFSFNAGPPPMPILLAADLNCDLIVDIADIVYMVSYMFAGGAAPCNPCE